MIRNVVLGRLWPGADQQRLAGALDGIRALAVEGMVGVRVGRDAGLREGNWHYAITADFADAYRRYDLDEEHNRLRHGPFAELSSQIARLQFEF